MFQSKLVCHQGKLLARRAVLITLALPVLAIGADQAGSLRYQFKPPDSITFSVETRSERTRWFDSTKSPTDSTISLLRRTIVRSKAGWVMTSRPLSIITKSDSSVVDNPLNQVLMSTRVSSQLDSAGLITKVSGYEKIPAAIDSLYSGDLAVRMKEVMTPANLNAKEQLGWNAKFQGLAGQPVVIGEMQYEKASYPLPAGKHIPFLVAIRVVDTVSLDGALCAIVVISADSDPMQIAKRLRRELDEIALEFPLGDTAGMAIVQGGSRYVADSRIVIEIATLLPRSESSQREITVMGESEQGPRKIRLVETETRRYDYH